jgi:uncharacterized protein YndB with AHSA1/START domain
VSATSHVFQVYIAATPQQVWSAITDSAWTRRWLHGTAFVEPPGAGRPYRTVTADGRDAVEGTIEQMEPPSEGSPGRLVQTWHVLYDAAMQAEPPGRVEWTVEAAGEGLTRVRLVHRDLALSPLTWARVGGGWVWVLDALKSVLETGRELPRATSTPRPRAADGDADGDADVHRRLAVEANNSVWELAEVAGRSPEQDEDLLRRAYAAAYHWQRAAGAGPQNQARADYMVAKALLLTGRPEESLRSADRCLRTCEAHGLADFDLVYAHEARARALAALGRTEQARAAWEVAHSVPVADDEDRAVVERDLADPPPGLARLGVSAG